MKKDLPFSLPDHYFENFPEKIRNRLETIQKPGSYQKSHKLDWTHLAIAAGMAALIMMGFFIVKSTLDSRKQTNTVEEYADIIDYYIYDFDDETIMTVFTEENNLNYLNHNFEAEEIIQYLSEDDDLNDTELENLY
jgi:hypothetical protein